MITWLLRIHSASANETAALAKIATFLRRFPYMPSMKASMMIAITAPMYTAIHTRVSLKRTCSQA